MSKKPRGLGAGFSSLLGNNANLSSQATNEDELVVLSISALTAGRFQPRTQWDDASLAELAASIKSQGVIQPIVVRPLAGGLYEIIAGERRWRAAKLAGLTSVPTVVRQLDDQAALAIALIENIQRENLTAIEEARAIRQLTDSFSLTHDQAAQVLGRSREAVSNLLRLLKLEASVQESVLDGQLSAGHARTLIALPEVQQKQLAQQSMSHQWSVRELEARVRALQEEKEQQSEATTRLSDDAEVVQLCAELSKQLGVSVRAAANAKEKGKIEIPFTNKTALLAIMQQLLQK